MSNMKLNIINMYPDILNMYGDIGNTQCIIKRCEWRGIEVNHIVSTLGSDLSINEEDIDMVLIGGGSDNQQSIVSKNLIAKRSKFDNYIENDGVVLAICGSYQMLGNDYLDLNHLTYLHGPLNKIVTDDSLLHKIMNKIFPDNILYTNGV